MQKSSLVGILRTFTKKEFRELRKWIISPMHNQRKDVAKLIGYLMEDGHLYNDSFLKKEAIYKWIYGKEPFNDAKIRQTIYFTTNCVEEFLIYRELMDDRIKVKTALSRVFRNRKLDKPFQKNLKETQKLQKGQIYRNGQFFHNEYNIQWEKYHYLTGFQRMGLELNDISNALDVMYLADKLRLSCFILAHQSVYKKEEYQIEMLEELLEVIKTKNFLDYPAIAIYYYGYMAQIEKDDESHFYNLKKEIIENGHLFPTSEMQNIYLMALNYCIAKINASIRHYLREAFELYKQGLEQRFLMDEGILSRYTFINVVTNATILKEYDWIESFIEEYNHYLEDKYRDNIVSYSKGRLHFERKEYDKALLLFSQVEYDDILINLNAKVMQLQMFYEQDELDVLESLLESMRTYLVRKKVIGYHRDNYKNIIRLTKKLVKVNPFSTAQKSKLQKEIEASSPLTEKKWLLEKLAEL